MYALDLIFNDGKTLEGLLWRWNPKGGVFEALDETNGKIRKFNLKDVKDGKFYSDRIRNLATFENFLDKARNDGWSGK